MRAFYFVLILFCSLSAKAQKEIKLTELKDHVGDSVIVQGTIASIRYLKSLENTPTFINIGGVYPNQLLMIVIGGDVRSKLPYIPTEAKDIGKTAWITGIVEIFKNIPMIVVNDPKQLDILVDVQLTPQRIKCGRTI